MVEIFLKKCEVENIIDLYMIYVISIVKTLINIHSRFAILGERERRKSIENQKINSVKNNTDENNCIYIYRVNRI